MNYNFYFLISLIVLVQLVKSVTVMTKKDILNLNLKQINKSSTCPEYSGGTFFDFKCSFTFYCLDDNNCQPDTNITSPFFEFTEKNGDVKNYIKEMCNKGAAETGDCTTEKCTADSDCISNSCFNSTCIQGKSLFTECSDNSDDSDIDNEIQVIRCGKPDGEECDRDKECAGRCFSASPYHNSCHSHVYLTPTAPIHLEYIIYGGIALLVLAIFVCICTRCCIGRTRKMH